jgi:hypothetical protein
MRSRTDRATLGRAPDQACGVVERGLGDAAALRPDVRARLEPDPLADGTPQQVDAEIGVDEAPSPVNPVLLKARVGSSLEKKRLRDQQKALVERFATSVVAHDMAESGFALGGKRVPATVMFTDIRGFTTLVEQQGPEKTIELLNTWYTLPQWFRFGTLPLSRQARAIEVLADPVRTLDNGTTLQLDNPAGTIVACLRGCLWVTRDGEPDDHIVEPGMQYTVAGSATMLVHAMADARCLIVQPRRA